MGIRLKIVLAGVAATAALGGALTQAHGAPAPIHSAKLKLVKPGALVHDVVLFDTGFSSYSGPGNANHSGMADIDVANSNSQFNNVKVSDHYLLLSAPCNPQTNEGVNLDYELRNREGARERFCGGYEGDSAFSYKRQNPADNLTVPGQTVNYTSIVNYDGDLAASNAGLPLSSYGRPEQVTASFSSPKSQSAQITYFPGMSASGEQLKELFLTVKGGRETIRKLWYHQPAATSVRGSAAARRSTKTLTPGQIFFDFSTEFSREVLYQTPFPTAGGMARPKYVTILPHYAKVFGYCPTPAQANQAGYHNRLNFEVVSRSGITDGYCSDASPSGKKETDTQKLNGRHGACSNIEATQQPDCSTMNLQPALTYLGNLETAVLGVSKGTYGSAYRISLDQFVSRGRIWFRRVPGARASLKEVTIRRVSETSFDVIKQFY